jgi:ribonuclease Z
MLTVVYLGTGAAVPSPGRDNTCLALDDGQEVTLVDTSGSPLKRLADAGLAPERLARVIITHKHLDHTFGLPSLLQSLWLSGRERPLPIYAEPETWGFLERLVDVYRPSSWTDAFPLEPHVVEPSRAPFLETGTFSVRSAPAQHAVPSIGLRFETAAGSALAYSSDTAPCSAITELARDADVLIHEATFLAGQEEDALRHGHSSARLAAEVAVAARPRRLVLIHFTPQDDGDLPRLRAGAAAVFPGPIDVPSDLERLTLP